MVSDEDPIDNSDLTLRNTSSSSVDFVKDENERKVSLAETALGIGILLVAIIIFFYMTSKRDS